VHAHDTRGDAAVLEIQVKRTISFAPADDLFRAYELAIATARISRKIDGAYQDVLTWARQLANFPRFS
jgi:hypothetical protein